MLKFIILSYIIIFSTATTFSQQADKIVGKYHLPNKLDVEIFKNSGKYFGKIIALNSFENGQTKDKNNPDKSKHDDLLVGKIIIKNLEFDKDEKEWVNGSMYGPEKGMVFNLKITEIRQNEIEVIGSKYFFWKTLEWKKL
ncbi:MAG: DUF2147 domain-containing protein [Bacteroidota bacterium]|nr:DUF2147 domain-containing protein [Bacteroidota bacterium]